MPSFPLVFFFGLQPTHFPLRHHRTRVSRAGGEVLKVAILHFSNEFLLLSPMLNSDPEGPVTGKE